MKSACFTGHRNIPNDYEELSGRLYSFVECGIINLGLTDFYTGGAIGWDTLAAQTILRLRNDYPHIRLNLVLPCSSIEQTAKWNQTQKDEYMRILSQADRIEYTSKHYFNGCMRLRNARLVELATERCYCYWNGNRKQSGTFQTICLARTKGIMVVNFCRNFN